MVPKKDWGKKENEINISIDDPVNNDSWRCAVVMAVEKTCCDSFVLKEFMEEALKGRRREINLISYENFVIKLLNYFSNGELDFKYSFLLNFSKIFQEAAEYVKQKLEIPVSILAKVVKAIIFFFREESLQKIEKKLQGQQDPIKAMADKPANQDGPVLKGVRSNNKKDQSEKTKISGQDGVVKIKPPSVYKEETKLLKRDEGAKELQSIDDAPYDGFFNLYILLIGFYHPELPVELIKAQVPLYGLLCIDSGLSGVKRIASSNYGKFQKRTILPKSSDVRFFWDEFLKILWDPVLNSYFTEVIFQVYSPQKLTCEKRKLREFIYREISYLMYDLSDYKRQHINYLQHMKLWNVEDVMRGKNSEKIKYDLDVTSYECFTVPVVLQNIINNICEMDDTIDKNVSSSTMINSEAETINSSDSLSDLSQRGSSITTLPWSQIICESGNISALNVYLKTKELDSRYHVNVTDVSSTKILTAKSTSKVPCYNQNYKCLSDNLAEALNSKNGVFSSYWKHCHKNNSSNDFSSSVAVDYCLYSILISKVICPYQQSNSLPKSKINSSDDLTIFKKNSSFQIIDNLNQEMQKPHFTVTECSRSVLKCIPYNVKDSQRDFFCPPEFKVVAPEKVRASSAPEFHVMPSLLNEVAFFSDLLLPKELLNNIEWNVYENLPKFLGNNFFLNTKGFNFIEELSKPKLLMKENQYWDEYNCADYAYSVLTDSILVVVHNRKGEKNTYCEAFNQSLKSNVGLRDFFEYVLEDEADWFVAQEELRNKKQSLSTNKSIFNSSINGFVDTDFWVRNSIKFSEHSKFIATTEKDVKDNNKLNYMKEGNKPSDLGKLLENIDESQNISDISQKSNSYYFEGYNVDDKSVQFSGLKTVYYAHDCCMTVELLERLYGKQDLGIHIRQGGHTLHLYNYVCPEPHILQPYTFHLTYKNGIILAFGKSFIEESENVEEIEDTEDFKKTIPKNERLPSDFTLKRVSIQKAVKKGDDEFAYEFKLSIPNGLMVEVLRRTVKPCYIKQFFFDDSKAKEERCRLFLPNGNLVKINKNGLFQVLKANTSILAASLKDLSDNITEPLKSEGRVNNVKGFLHLNKYEITTSSGFSFSFSQGNVQSSKKIQVFQNIDVESNQTYFRRMDGTSYTINNNGILCVQFKDGTKISSAPFFEQSVDESEIDKMSEDECIQGTDFELDCIYVYEEITIEHPAYATVIYNSLSQEWKINLPFGSVAVIGKKGSYFIKIDEQTNLTVEKELIKMNRFSSELDLLCAFTADLKVFSNNYENNLCNDNKKIYCKMEASTGETYVVEANSNSYILPKENSSGTIINFSAPSSFLENQSSFTDDTLNQNQCKNESEKDIRFKGNVLTTENKYFVVRKNFTGFQIFHENEIKNIFSKLNKGTIVYTFELPCSEKLRCFVVMSPVEIDNSLKKKWEINSILPSPIFQVSNIKKKTSSLYISPPTWTHPFPKRKVRFEVPENLTCRVFIETTKTDLSPSVGLLDCEFCEVADPDEDEISEVECGIQNIQKFAQKLSEDNQDFLKKMYLKAASKIINKKNNYKPPNMEFLNRYLKMSNYVVGLQNFHKHSIRFHLVPKYFNHHVGLSWFVLNNLIDNLNIARPESQRPLSQKSFLVPSLKSFSSFSSLSNEEIEYALSWNSSRSYSDISWHAHTSSKTAPAHLTKEAICKCKVLPTRNVVSAPIYKFNNVTIPNEDFKDLEKKICEPREIDQNTLIHLSKKKSLLSMPLEDLICLGLV